MSQPLVVWSIAGFDPSAGAGITADLMTFASHGLFGCSAITALTAQSTLGVKAIEAVSEDFLAQTLATLREDLPPIGIKIGMLHTPELMRVVAEFLQTVRGNSSGGQSLGTMAAAPVAVLDPVLRSSSGRDLYPVVSIRELKRELLPLVDVVTPNWSELAALTGEVVDSLDTADRSARALIAGMPHLHVVVTGGDQARAVDLLVSSGEQTLYFEGEHIASRATHGTGCAFSSSLLANLVLGRKWKPNLRPNVDEGVELDMRSAVRAAKFFVREAIRRAPEIGHGKGPMNLLWNRPLAESPAETVDQAKP